METAAPAEPLRDYRRQAQRLRFAEAARAGEAILDRARDLASLRALRAPFDFGRPASSLPAAYRDEALGRADRFVAERPREPWGYLFRRLLRHGLRAPYAQEDADAGALASFAARRYGWLGAETGRQALSRADFPAALRRFRAAAGFARPEDWDARCLEAEALACLGRAPQALALLERLEARGPEDGRDAARAQRGKLLLWTGRERRALEALRSSRLDRVPGPRTWLGGALVRLGRREEALAVLAEAVRAHPDDLEARIWRVEALHGLGRHREAAAEGEEAEPLNRFEQNLYLHAARGLARHALGDSRGLRRDYDAVRSRAYVLDAVLRRLRRLERYHDEPMAESLRALLAMSRGLRRGAHEIWAWIRPWAS